VPPFTPSNIFFAISSLIDPDNQSTSIRKMNEARKSSCLIPTEGLNSLVGLPFTRMNIDVEAKHHLIYVIHLV